MSTSEKRKSTTYTHAIRASTSSRSNIIAAPPRAQLIRPASTSTAPSAESDTQHEQGSSITNSVGKDGGSSQAAKEREKILQDKIGELKRELAENEAEFTRALDRLSQNESETASYWQNKYSTLNQQFLRVDTEARVLRTEVDVREAEKTELREEWEFLQRELSQRDTEIRSLRTQIAGLKQWVSTNTKKSDQASDEEFGETVAKLRNGLQNWAVSHFRKSSFGMWFFLSRTAIHADML
jgi:activating signal cointegrator complex subunit 1